MVLKMLPTISSKVSTRLAAKVRGELDNEVKQQCLFQLLGKEYVAVQFPHHRWNPRLLEKTDPHVNETVRPMYVFATANCYRTILFQLKEGYFREMKELLEEQCTQVQKEMNMPEDVR